MNKLKLETYGVHRMPPVEMIKKNGGNLAWIVMGVIVIEVVIFFLGLTYQEKKIS